MTSSRHILVLYAQPNPMKSGEQSILHRAIADLEAVEIRDLYQMYPHFYIDAAAEREALLRADLIIFQYPLHWFSAPALLKEWQDMVLEQGFAYGHGSTALRAKDFLQVISSGRAASSHLPQDGQQLLALLRPFEAMAQLCGMNYHHPFCVPGLAGHHDRRIEKQAHVYRRLLMDYQERGGIALNHIQGSQPHD